MTYKEKLKVRIERVKDILTSMGVVHSKLLPIRLNLATKFVDLGTKQKEVVQVELSKRHLLSSWT